MSSRTLPLGTNKKENRSTPGSGGSGEGGQGSAVSPEGALPSTGQKSLHKEIIRFLTAV